jgi:hypothetical protein
MQTAFEFLVGRRLVRHSVHVHHGATLEQAKTPGEQHSVPALLKRPRNDASL